MDLDGFTINIGKVPCFFVDSRCSNCNSAFDASEENQKTLILDSELIVSGKSTNSNNRESEFHVSEAAFKQSMHLIIDIVITCFGPVYGVCCFARKQEPIASANNSKIQIFQLHDEFIVNFDPRGRFGSCSLFFVFKVLRQIQFRLWWIPWDKGKQGLSSFNSIHAIIEAHVFISFCLVRFNTVTPLKKLLRARMYCFEISIQNSDRSRNRIASFCSSISTTHHIAAKSDFSSNWFRLSVSKNRRFL
uniref:Uncharacterized protein n=1 Tax=Medicago truncatula TaxID=3880 RepID=A2Q1C4_MEDTR|nr:hypothetical protein MtrDRAFT_AC148775g13v2 [Medicago truncatula]